ncbi:MAG: hypothetical protein GY725_00180 [bacterium]|nr:hypothetical protein [bacterium]
MKPGILICLVLFVTTVAVYAPVRGHDFVEYDDGSYVYQNRIVLGGLSVAAIGDAFTSIETGANWHPLTVVAHTAVHQLFGLDAGLHHLVNVVIHALNCVLLFLLFRRMKGTLWPSAFLAFVFALHPLHVESVAWVSELKDVLSTLFFILAILAYLHYAERPGVGRYLVVAAAFGAGLLAKPMIVTLPFVLLLLDGWPLRRFGPGSSSETPLRRLVLEKLPLLALSLADSIATYLVQLSIGAVRTTDALPLAARLANSLVAYAVYLGKTLWPANLSVLYYHVGAPPVAQTVAAALLLVAISAYTVKKAADHPHLFVGWFFYLGTLVPVIGLVQVGQQSLADRYMYIPMIGLLIMVGWSVPQSWLATIGRRRILATAAIAIVIACASATALQLRHWRDTLTLFEQAARVDPNNPVAQNNVAWIYATHSDPRIRKPAEAVRRAELACRLTGYVDPSNIDTLAAAYAAEGHFDRAIETSESGIRRFRALERFAEADLAKEALASYRVGRALHLDP